VQRAGEFSLEMAQRTGDELRLLTGVFRQRIACGEPVRDLVPRAFAAVSEATIRAGGAALRREQLLAGAALTEGRVVDMKDGEGKSLTAVLPAYLHALAGQGVHIACPDSYLAHRDAVRASAVLGVLGMSVGLTTSAMEVADRARAYAADLTYASYQQLCFDYLRDNLAHSPEQRVQRGPQVAIVDEADAILIDHGSEPPTLSWPQAPDTDQYLQMAHLAAKLTRDTHFQIDDGTGSVYLTEDGLTTAEAELGVAGLLEVENLTTIGALEQAIRAADWYQPGEDYVIQGGRVRPGDARRDSWRAFDHGVRQSIEAREGLDITWTSVAHGRIMVRDYFRRYRTLAGLTAAGTAAAAELGEVYGLKVVAVPARHPVTRADHGDLLHRTATARIRNVVELTRRKHAAGQPVIIASASAAEGGQIGEMLTARGIAHAVIPPGTEPADAMARAGQPGAVTVLCGAAGRGYRVPLGGDVSLLARELLTAPGDPGSVAAARQAAAVQVSAHRDVVVRAGGLAVLGSQRNAERRHDDWVRGLAGQQGEPGESQFLVSLEDPLVLELSSGRAVRMMTRAMVDGTPAGRIEDIVDGVQQDAETAGRERRSLLRGFEQVESGHREQLYARRQDIFQSGDLRKQALETIDEVIGWNTEAYEDPARLHTALTHLYPVTLSVAELGNSKPGATGTDRLILTERIRNDARRAFGAREQELGQEAMGQLVRRVMLTVTDDWWAGHLAGLTILIERIGWGREDDPDALAEYQAQADELFSTTLARILEDTVRYLFFAEAGSTLPESRGRHAAPPDAAR
jgi:preprotein translocase subunit SecA